MTKHLSHLAQQIKERFPLAKVELDEPANEGGAEHLDVRLGDRLVVVEWRRPLGFGVSLVTEAALDNGPDFRLADSEKAFACVSLLLTEAQDALFREDLGSGEVTTTANDVPREDSAVAKGDRIPPRREAA
jgi:hypothetical protein